jgi:aspartate-semialdehyde dehydrogenase
LNNQPLTEPKTFPHQIAFNNVPQIGKFDESGFCAEEIKIMSETRKILGEPRLRISAFTVRTPTLNSHSEAVWVTTKKEASRAEILSAFRQAPGLIVQDETISNNYPMAITASGNDPVYVGRIHQDPNDKLTWMFWVVADNLRKGAATNGLQIAEQIFDIHRGT